MTEVERLANEARHALTPDGADTDGGVCGSGRRDRMAGAPLPEEGNATASARPPLWLVGLNGEFQGREWSCDTTVEVGRLPSSGLRLDEPAPLSVSRRHAVLFPVEGRWWVADRGSMHGTYLNGTRIGAPAAGPLRAGDIIQFGTVAVRVGAVARPTRSWSDLSVPAFWSGAETIRVGEPNRSGPLTVFPLFRSPQQGVDYLLSDEAMAGGWLTASEVSAEGRISELTVENRSERRVLFLDGEELRRGKQNRILNTTVMVPARCTIRVPVSCVERGRWAASDRPDMGTGSVSSSHLRHTLRTSVTRSLCAGAGHSSDQRSVWDDVRTQQHSLGVTSPTGSMSDTVTACAGRVATVRRSIPYTEGSTGVLVAVGRRVVSVDLFDSPETCGQVWDRFVTGLALDGLMAGAEVGEPSPEQITNLFAEAGAAAWVPVGAVGDGIESRTEFGGVAGSVLVVDGVLVHGSLVGGKRTVTR